MIIVKIWYTYTFNRSVYLCFDKMIKCKHSCPLPFPVCLSGIFVLLFSTYERTGLSHLVSIVLNTKIPSLQTVSQI